MEMHQKQVLSLPGPTGPHKIKVKVFIEGALCVMELDTGSSISLISSETLKKLCPRGGPGLTTLDFILLDYQHNQVPMLGVGKFCV